MYLAQHGTAVLFYRGEKCDAQLLEEIEYVNREFGLLFWASLPSSDTLIPHPLGLATRCFSNCFYHIILLALLIGVFKEFAKEFHATCEGIFFRCLFG